MATPKKRMKKNSTKRLNPSTRHQRRDGMMREVLSQLTEAAYVVTLKTGFRGSFIKFLTELQEALGEVIRKDEEKRAEHPIGRLSH